MLGRNVIKMIKGKGVSVGIGFGNIVILKNEIRKIEKNIVEDSDKELERFHKALEEVINETNQIVEKARGTEKEIMTAYLMIMQDPSLILETESQIKNSKINAEYATEMGFNSVIQIFENMDDEYMSGRARDIADIKDRIISKLYNEEKIDLSKLKNNTIIVAKELTTSDTAKLDFKNISGIITEVGGENSHTSIMARTHLLPAVTKVENATTILKNGEYVAINGGSGEIFENPTEEQQQNLIKIQKDFIESKVELEKYKNSESKTKDRFKVELVSNIGTPADVELVLKNTEGLKPSYKMIGLLIIAVAYVVFLVQGLKIGTETYIPILKMYIDIPIFIYIPLATIVILATTNAVNLTDGIDGLSSSVSAIIITCLTVIGISNQVYEISIFGSIVIGAVLGFLIFNLHPAKVFMGDTGSLMLGGVISGLALYLKMPLLLLIIAIIPVLETLSVILQVAYFKKTGNRIFKMAPLHHHFELSGWKENKVVVVFSLITLISCFIGLKII